MQPGCGCSAAQLLDFLLQSSRKAIPAARGQKQGSTGCSARPRRIWAPLGKPRGAGKGLHVPGRLAAGRVT